MPFSKLCPICRKNRIFRKEVKTCGAPECINGWRAMSSEQKAYALTASDGDDVDISDWLLARAPNPAAPSVPTMPSAGSDSVEPEPVISGKVPAVDEEAKRALDKIFKEDK